MWRSDGAGGSAASARRAAASESGSCGSKRPLGHRRERRRAEAEVAVGLGVELAPRASPRRRGSAGTAQGARRARPRRRRGRGPRTAPLPPPGRARAPSARGARRPGRGTRRPPRDRSPRSSRNVRTISTISTSASSSSSLRTSVEQEIERPLEGVEVERELCDGGSRGPIYVQRRTRPFGTVIFGPCGGAVGRGRAEVSRPALRPDEGGDREREDDHGDVEVQPQAEVLVRRVDAQRLLVGAKRRVPGDVEREEARRADLEAPVDEKEERRLRAGSRATRRGTAGGRSARRCTARAGSGRRSRGPREGRVGLPKSSWLK